jgi:hypothetical protein
MNLLIPPLIASVMVTGFVSIATVERNSGGDRQFAAQNMVKHHNSVVENVKAMAIGTVTIPQPVADPDMRPFLPVLDWESVIARDTAGRIWLLTYLNDAGFANNSTILDTSAAQLPFELARTSFTDGAFGAWSAASRSVASTGGKVVFEGASAPVIPDVMPVIISFCERTGTVLNCAGNEPT